MRLIKNLPNILTLINLFLGCLAIVYIFQDHMIIMENKKDLYVNMGMIDIACICVFIAAIIDFFDGFVARLLHAQSELGKQLDSLADMVTFGLVPGVILYELLARSYYMSADAFDYPILYYASGFAVTLFAALRLANFNIDTKQLTSFRGLPTPSMALIICSLPLIILRDEMGLSTFFSNKWTLLTLDALLCYLMVSDIPMIGLKMSSFNIQQNLWQATILIASLIVILWGLFIVHIEFLIIPVIIILYIVISIVKNIRENGL